jgi:transposase
MERLTVPQITDILYRLQRGQSERAIARDLSLSRDAVRRYRQFATEHQLLEPSATLPSEAALFQLLGPAPTPPSRTSQLEAYRTIIEPLLDRGVEKQAIHQRLTRSHGYTGSYSALCRYVERIRPKEPNVTVRIETAPGEQAQVDFGTIGSLYDARTGKSRTAHAFVMTLSYSRHMYVEFVFDQTIATWIRCHNNAFRFFRGCPREVVVDNLKAAVLSHALEDPVLCEPYRKMARHYGFLVHPCRPRTPRHKGKVENGVHYVKRNLVGASDFHDREDANEKGLDWCLNQAGLREHGTTHEMPLARFQQTEREALLPLPEEPFELRSVQPARVHPDCHVVFEGSYYSAPYTYAGKTVDLHAYEKVVQLYDGVDLLVTHERATRKGQRLTRLEHYPEEKAAYLTKTPDVCRLMAQEIGPSCTTVVDHLFSERVSDHLRAVHALLRLGGEYGPERLEAACKRAVHFGRPQYVNVKSILKAGLDSEPLPGQVEPTPKARAFRHERTSAEFFGQREVASC